MIYNETIITPQTITGVSSCLILQEIIFFLFFCKYSDIFHIIIFIIMRESPYLFSHLLTSLLRKAPFSNDKIIKVLRGPFINYNV